MIFNLNAQKRTTNRKSDLTTLRSAGMIPAVLYGKNHPSIPIAINGNEFHLCYKKSLNELAFFEISLDGEKFHTILKDKLIHTVGRHLLHMDFMIVQDSARLEVDIPVQFVCEAIGTKEGGFVDIIQRTVKLSCRAKDMPEDIKLDISNLRVGDSLHVRDLPSGSWHYKDHIDVTLVVVHPKKHEEVKPAEQAPEASAEKPAE